VPQLLLQCVVMHVEGPFQYQAWERTDVDIEEEEAEDEEGEEEEVELTGEEEQGVSNKLSPLYGALQYMIQSIYYT